MARPADNSNMECADDKDRCLSFPEQGPCLVGAGNRQGWNCDICRAIERWKSEGRDLVLLREILQQRGLYVRPGEHDGIPSWDQGCYLLQMSFHHTPSTEIRQIFQEVLTSAEQTWIAQNDRSVRIR